MGAQGGMRRQFLYNFLILILVSLAVVGAVLAWFFYSHYMDTLQENLKAEAELMGSLVRQPLQQGELDQVRRLVDQAGEDLERRVTVVDRHGVVWADSQEDPHFMENHRQRPEIKAAAERGWGVSSRHSDTLQVEMFYGAKHLADAGGEPLGFVRLAVPLTHIHQALQQFFLILGGGIAAAAALSALLAYRLARGLVLPVEEITRVAQQIAAGDLHRRALVRASHEMAAMRDAVNRMAESLEQKVRELTQSKEKMEAILTYNVAALVLLNPDLRVEMANPAARRLVGPDLEAGGAAGGAALRNYELKQLVQRARDTGELQEQEIFLVYPGRAQVAATAVPLTGSPGGSSVLLVVQDITELRRLERVRSEFVANVSHELKTPITSIRGFAETMLEGASRDPEAAEEFSRIIYREADRLHHLVHDLLDLTRLESGRGMLDLRPVDLNRVAQETLERFRDRARESGQTLVEDLFPGALELRGDPERLQQVFYNLLDNALKHTPAPGTVSLSTWKEEGCVAAAVSDTGPGIPPEDLPRVFERFYRVDRARSRGQGGTGLGLAIVKHIVEAHGGTVTVDSRPGAGATFVLRIPMEESGPS